MHVIFVSLFLLLLFLSNLFLFKDGLWLYQDQSAWYKNGFEAFTFFNTQFHLFSNVGYYLGYDQGILSANNTLVYSIFLGFFHLFGSSGSQIVVAIASYILAFISFLLFSSLFFKERKIQYILALLFTFNPLMYSFRGQGLIYAAAPLFVYSFYKFYTAEKYFDKYLLLNIFASFLWIANVRFLQLDFFIVVPYLLYILIVVNKSKLYIRRLVYYLIANIVVFSPVIYAFLAPLFQNTPSIFNYGAVFNNFVVRGSVLDMFNPFQSVNVILYDNRIYVILGLFFFISVITLLLRSFKEKVSSFLILNISILVLGMTFFELGYIVGRDLYPVIIKIVPFLTNAPFNGIYVMNIPFILLVGMIGAKRIKALYALSAYFLIISIIPLLQLSSFILQKYPLEKIPTAYQSYFVTPYAGIPESTSYVPFNCWRAEYMNKADTPTHCVNFGLRYSPAVINNPRAVSAQELYLAEKLPTVTEIDNFRVTHNLKNVIVAKDIVVPVDFGPKQSQADIVRTEELDEILSKKDNLYLKQNQYFNHYSFTNKNSYDFFIYAPKQIIFKDEIDTIFDESLDIHELPVILSNKDKEVVKNELQRNIKITYKQSQFDATKYYVKLDNVDTRKAFIVQLAQAYKPGWKLQWVDKKQFNDIACQGKSVEFPITNNIRCIYSSMLFDIHSLYLLTEKSVSEERHLQGNYVANTWYILPQDIPQSEKGSSTLHAVLIYKNQLYYLIALLFAGSGLLLLGLYTLMQEAQRMFKKH